MAMFNLSILSLVYYFNTIWFKSNAKINVNENKIPNVKSIFVSTGKNMNVIDKIP